MGFFGKLNDRLGALAQGAVGGLLPRIDRLDAWCPDSPPERTDYQALWREATVPTHPIVDARVRLRTVEQSAEDRYGCRQRPITGELDALDASTKAALAAETLKRFAFLDYCVWIAFNSREKETLARLGHFGISRDAFIALEYDYEGLATHLLSKSKPGLDAEQTQAVAHVAVFVASRNPHCTSVRELIPAITPVLCDPLARTDERKREALAGLFHRLGEAKHLTQHPHPQLIALIEAIAKIIGVSPETHPIVRAKRANDALIEEARQAVIALSGPQLKRLFESALQGNAQGQYVPTFSKGSPEALSLDALTPAERGEALLHALRVLNFATHCGPHPSGAVWPEGKYTSFRKADYPRIRDYPSGAHAGLSLVDLFQHLARKRIELGEDMQVELLQLLRRGVADNVIRSLQVVKIIEGFAKGNASPRVHGEMEATVAWLKGVTDHYAVKFKAAALHRLEKAVTTMAPATGIPAGPASAAGARSETTPAAVRLPGGFGRRAVPPAEGPTPRPKEPSASEEPRLAPPGKPDASGHPSSIVDFYGDLADLRKCSAEHIAFLDELIGADADPAADFRRIMAENDHLTGLRLTEQQRNNAIAAMRARLVSERACFREIAALLKSRMEILAGLSAPVRSLWPAFHDHARALYGKSKPAGAWLKAAYAILDASSVDEQSALVTAVVGGYRLTTANYPTDDAVRGLIYCAVRLPAEKVAPAIAGFARKQCFETVAGVGIRDKRMGNACLWTLINMPDGAGVPYLARLLNRIKYPSVKKTINAALDEAAEKAGLSRGALDELSVPTHDLENGKREIAIGPDGGAALLEIVGSADVSLAFRRADGKTTASAPAEFKAFKSEISAARATAKEIEADLTTQIARLQRIWLERRDWSFTEWETRYAGHPLLAALTRRLIWDVGEGDARRSAVLMDGALSDADGKPVDAADARIALWHPIGRPPPEVLGWRKRLAALGIVQPFKQAHREVYYVTDAERTTGIYSNRFAGHILRQHQMMTLARLNHWNVTHRIWADVRNDEPTHLVIPAWNIVAELWTEGAGGESPEVSDSQAYLFISTNQVRFHAIDGAARVSAAAFGPQRGEAIRMDAVPEIVFSEVMRHCDLFTSVASVANDPNWIDAGADAQHPDQWRRTVANPYWHEAALGDLSQSATSRKEVLTTLLPALRIADRCSIDGNYLRVRGNLHSYRIHFGSGNILMEPESRYLCIVKDTPRDSGLVMLPFEGDTMLSVIISKALLMAEDDKISDPIITRQIGPGSR